MLACRSNGGGDVVKGNPFDLHPNPPASQTLHPVAARLDPPSFLPSTNTSLK
jgi:hypothetical protein